MSRPLASRWAFAATVALLIAPALVVDVPPLSDFPNHLARVHVLVHGAPWWTAAWDLLPNLAVDLPGVVLAPLLGLERFGRLFVAATVLVWCLGCRTLGRELAGRHDARALVACALVWSEPLLLGYAGFTLGLGLGLLTLAAAHRALAAGRGEAGRGEAGAPRDGGGGTRAAVVTALLGLATTVAHAGAAAIVIASTCAFVAVDLAQRGSFGRAARRTALALVPAALFLGQWWVRRATHGDVSFATPGMIVRALGSPVTGLDRVMDLASLGLLALLAVVALGAARPLRIRAAPAAAACVCLVLVAVFPSDVAGGIEVHGRFALGAWVLALFAIDRRSGAELAGTPSAAAPTATKGASAPTATGTRWVAVAALTLFAARTLHLTGELRILDAEARGMRAAIARALPPGASLATAWFFPDDRMAAADRVRALATLHVPALAVVDRGAHVPTLYALPGVQPLRYTGGLPRAHRFAASEPGPDMSMLASRFDFVWLCGGPPSLERELLLAGSAVERIGRCVLIDTGRQDVALVR